MLTARRERFKIPEAQHQFPGGGIFGGPGFGFGIVPFGSGGFAAGGFLGSPAAGAIGPVLTLESEFGVGFTSQSIADAILVAEQEGRFTSEGAVTGAITIATGPTLTLVLNLARGLFELFNTSGQKVGGGVTPEAAIEAARAGAPPLLGGGGTEPLPFPRPSTWDQLSRSRRRRRELSAQNLRVLSRAFSAWLKVYRNRLPLLRPRRWLPSWDSLRSFFAEATRLSEPRYPRLRSSRPSRRSRRPISRPLSRLRRQEYDLVERSTSRWSWARQVIPPGYVVRVFRIKNNSAERSKSDNSSPTCSRFGKHDRTQTSNAEHSSSSLPRGWNN